MRRAADWRGLAPADRGAALALGNFDGLHKGHLAVIAAAREAALRARAPLGVAVFKPHPRRFFQPQTAPFRIMSNEVRARLLAEMGVDILYELPFDRDLSLKDDRGFVRDVLAEGLGARAVAAGFDFRFGRDRVGDAAGLERLGGEHAISVHIVGEVGAAAGGKCSSTAIRQAIAAGDVETAASMLGRPWIVDGVVVRGDQRGRLLGYPTANVSLGPLLRPKYGIYAVEARLEGEAGWRPGVASMGLRPTFGGADERFEVYLIDFSGDLYGRRLEIAVRAYLRPEWKFPSEEALKAKIAEDVAAARAALAR